MDVNGHTQMDVEIATGVPQPQISRALNGQRKRPTGAMRKLCQYAELEIGEIGEGSATSLVELTELLQRLVAGGPATTACTKGVLESLALLLRYPVKSD